jgi:hypothetical protein
MSAFARCSHIVAHAAGSNIAGLGRVRVRGHSRRAMLADAPGALTRGRPKVRLAAVASHSYVHRNGSLSKISPNFELGPAV